MTKDDVEIDLILEKPNSPLILIEIKSTDLIKASDLSSFIKISSDFNKAKAYCFSNDPQEKQFENVTCLHWQKGLQILKLSEHEKAK